MENTKVLWPGWETVRLLGRGSFGAVYEIQRDIFGDVEKAALKVISLPLCPGDIDALYHDGYDKESIAGMYKEYLAHIVRACFPARMQNAGSNLVMCDDICCRPHDDGIGWDVLIKMELLTPLMKARPAEFSEEMVIKLAKDMCTALEVWEKYGMVHQDVKPTNIFLSPAGEYKLSDGGIAEAIMKIHDGPVLGMQSHTAPEVYNDQPYNSRADIYSLGMVLYRFMNDYRGPFCPLFPAKMSAELERNSHYRRLSGEKLPEPKNGSKKLKAIVLKACAYDPKDRYASATEMLNDLCGESQIEPTPAPDPDEKIAIGVDTCWEKMKVVVLSPKSEPQPRAESGPDHTAESNLLSVSTPQEDVTKQRLQQEEKQQSNAAEEPRNYPQKKTRTWANWIRFFRK